MKKITIVKPGFKEVEVEATVKSKEAQVNGESFIVDWGDPAYGTPKNAFIKATNSIKKLFKSSFVAQRNHHSTIISKQLDPIDRSEGLNPPIWRDPDLSLSRQIFREYLNEFVLELQLCVCASGGTIQLVYRNETIMPQIRQKLIELGAEVKPRTLDGDRINTCTVVLGYLNQVPECEIVDGKISETVAVAPPLIKVTCASLIRYQDTSLNKYDTIERFEYA